MKLAEARHYLSVLIELDLFPTLRALAEDNFSQEQLNNEQQRMSINFINRLPENYRKIKNRDEIIAKTLQRMGMKTMWGEKKIEEITALSKRKKSGQEKGNSHFKSDRGEISSEEIEK